MAGRRPHSVQSIDGIRRSSRASIRDAAIEYHQKRRATRRLAVVSLGMLLTVLVVWLFMPIVTLATRLVPLWQPGTYLVLLQNDAELRPSGGFIGSYAVVHVRQNRSFDYRIETNIYKIDNAFTAVTKLTPPAPLQGIAPHWALRDSNWDIDFAMAAKTVAWFYEEETGESVDGVIGVTAQAGKQLLGAIGPIRLADGTELANNESFYNTLAYKVEKEYFITAENRSVNEPKSLLVGLVPQVVRRLWLPWNDVQVAHWLRRMLETKQILLAFFDEREQTASSLGWAGRLLVDTQHFLSVNNANLGGMKSSQYMTESQHLNITTNGTTAEYQLSIERTHHGTGEWPDHRNDNLARIVVPSGATLGAAMLDGEAVAPSTEESIAGAVVVGFRIDTNPGTTRVLQVVFNVPIQAQRAAKFRWQKQSGVRENRLEITFNGATILEGTFDRDQIVSLP